MLLMNTRQYKKHHCLNL